MTEQAAVRSFDPAHYWEQRLSDRYTLGSVGWSSLGEAFNRWSYAVRRRVFDRFVRTVLADSTPVRALDVGSGTGVYVEAWQRLGVREITGCDLTAAAVEQLKLNFPRASFHKVDIGDETPSLPAARYDAISIIDVLFHIVDDERYVQALRNLTALLSPDGILVFTENYLPEQVRGEHQVSRTKAHIEALLSQVGLTPVRQRPVFFLMNTPIAVHSRALHAWWGLVTKVVRRHETIGWVVGAMLFPIEVALSRILRKGPSTIMVACRRV
jgi:SAM-dependent methyltransferase